MKYIRTKDGHVFEAEKDLWLYGRSRVEAVIDMQGNVIDVTSQDNILKEADTIEELCDAFVKKSKEQGNDYFVIDTDANIVFDRKYRKTDLTNYNHYGAIFTEQGLIYVAKINEKGEWELL